MHLMFVVCAGLVCTDAFWCVGGLFVLRWNMATVSPPFDVCGLCRARLYRCILVC